MFGDTVFADGTPSDGKAADMDQRPAEEWESEFMRVTQPGRRHKLEANPPAATVHKKEQGAPWRIKYEREIEEDNRVAEMEIQKKRVTLLSHQTCKGMARVYGVNYDVTEFGNILNQAYKVRARNQAATRGTRRRSTKASARRGSVRASARASVRGSARASARNSARNSAASRGDDDDEEEDKQSENDVRALQVLEAVLRFDLKKVVELLKLRPVDNSDQILATRTVVLSGRSSQEKRHSIRARR